MTPVETESISAIPIIPILPANAVRSVRPFFVIRLFLERANAVKNDMDGFLTFFCSFLPIGSVLVSFVYGSESDIIFPSNNFMVLVAYCSASSGLCVTIIISLSFEISLRISII